MSVTQLTPKRKPGMIITQEDSDLLDAAVKECAAGNWQQWTEKEIFQFDVLIHLSRWSKRKADGTFHMEEKEKNAPPPTPEQIAWLTEYMTTP